MREPRDSKAPAPSAQPCDTEQRRANAFDAAELQQLFSNLSSTYVLKNLELSPDALTAIVAHLKQAVTATFERASTGQDTIRAPAVLRAAQIAAPDLHNAYDGSDLVALQFEHLAPACNAFPRIAIQQLTHEKMINTLFRNECSLLYQILNCKSSTDAAESL